MISIAFVLALFFGLVTIVLFGIAVLNGFAMAMSDSREGEIYDETKRTVNIILIIDAIFFILFLLTIFI